MALESAIVLLRDLKCRRADIDRLGYDAAQAMSLLVDVMTICNVSNLTTKSHDTAAHIIKDALLYGPDIDALSTGSMGLVQSIFANKKISTTT